MLIKRDIAPSIKKELDSDLNIVLTGIRRVGKTTLIRSLYGEIKHQRKLYLDLENPLNQELFNKLDYEAIKQNLEGRALGRGERLIVFLDEVQMLKKIPSIVKYLSDHYKIKFILTGSASFYLKNLFTESLAGRKRVFELFPLSFSEFLNFKDPKIKKPSLNDKVTSFLYHSFEKYLNEYIEFGGFPGVVLQTSAEEKNKELNEVFTSYWQKEVLLLSDFRKTSAFREIILLLSARTGSKLDISKIAAELGITRVTVSEYLNFLEQSYFINRIKFFSRNIDVSYRAQKKTYFCDCGIVRQLGDIKKSSVFENLIYNFLSLKNKVYYYQSKNKSEIDFITKSKDKLRAFEVKTFAHQSDVNKLARLAKRLKIKNYFVVSEKFSPLPCVVYPFQL